MSRLYSFLNSAGGAFIFAVAIFVLALVGHMALPLALAIGGIMVAYGLILLLGRRWDAIAVLGAPGEDERTSNVHMRAAATAGQVMALVIVGGFFYDVARGAVELEMLEVDPNLSAGRCGHGMADGADAQEREPQQDPNGCTDCPNLTSGHISTSHHGESR